ncbi:MAG: hypothetical protein M1820_001331 [Bogoriella megaspora]|nr:MAG: hypothetical protein M1820_001331 [Bogoriella megaspora]
MATSAASPGSNAESNAQKLSAPKDKTCPFCGVNFTSSSLGRHLDLYIKEKNPKPPDGVHNVDEIRKLRGGITRRQARGSATRRESSTPGSVTRMPNYDQTSMLGYDTAMNTPEARMQFKLNELNWQATGVINGLPGRGSAPTPSLARDPSTGHHQQLKADYEMRRKALEERENGRAAELALQEVLGSINAATSLKPEAKPLFDFNPYSMSFPALCLRILPTPPTLFSATPFAQIDSWTVEPPGQEQHESTAQTICDLLKQRDQQSLQLPEERTMREIKQQDPEARRLLQHVKDAYRHWESLSDEQRTEAWKLEMLRAFSTVRDEASETSTALDEARKEIEHLRNENDKLSRCQQPREFILHPPSLLPVPSSAAKALNNPDFDFDRLMDKWRGVVRENRRGMEAQRTFVESPSSQPQPPTPFQQPPTPAPPQPNSLITAGTAHAHPFSQQPSNFTSLNHGHTNGTNGINHISKSNNIGQTNGTGKDTRLNNDTNMGDEEEEDRDADGDADVEIDGDGTPGNQQQQQQQQTWNAGNVKNKASVDGIDQRFLDPKLDGTAGARAGAQEEAMGMGMDGVEGGSFMEE